MSAAAPVLPPDTTSSKKPRRRPKPVVHKSTRKSPSVQTAITARRIQGQSKSQIARELRIGRNTVTSVLELNDVEQQIAEARQSAIALAPAAITAIDRDLTLPGSGALGLRLLNDIGAIGEDAIDTLRRNSVRQSSAINILVQPGGTVAVQSGNETVTDKYHTGTGNKQVTAETGQGTPPVGKQPKDGVGH